MTPVHGIFILNEPFPEHKSIGDTLAIYPLVRRNPDLKARVLREFRAGAFKKIK